MKNDRKNSYRAMVLFVGTRSCKGSSFLCREVCIKVKKENLEARLDVRVTREERQEIQEQAEASGLSVSEYVRRRMLGRRIDSVMDIKMLSELRRQGGLLKEIFNESNGMYNDKTAVALDSINRFIECLERKILNKNGNLFTSVQ